MMDINEEIQKNEKLIRDTIWRIYPSLVDDEDIQQIGRIALWNALKAYRTEGTATFSTYASRFIRNAVVNEIRKRTNEKHTGGETVYTISLQDPLKDTEEMNIEDVVSGSKDIESYSDVADWLRKLDGMDREIVINKSKGKSDQQIAKILNIHQTSVSRKVKRLKKSLTDECL